MPVGFRLHGFSKVLKYVDGLAFEKICFLSEGLLEAASQSLSFQRPLESRVGYLDRIQILTIRNRRPTVRTFGARAPFWILPGTPENEFTSGCRQRTHGAQKQSVLVDQIQVAPGAQDGENDRKGFGRTIHADAYSPVDGGGLHACKPGPDEMSAQILGKGRRNRRSLRHVRKFADAGKPGVARQQHAMDLCLAIELQDQTEIIGLDNALQDRTRKP